MVTFRNLLIAKAAVCLVLGLFLLLAPAALLRVLGADLGPGGMFTAREYGAALTGSLLLMWYGRNVADPAARRAVLLYLLVYDAIGVGITVAAVVSGVLNVLGWGVVLVYLCFAVGAGYVIGLERGESSRIGAAA